MNLIKTIPKLDLNKIIIPNNQDKNNPNSEFSLYLANKNLLPCDSKSVDMSFLDKYRIGEFSKEDERLTEEYFRLITIDELTGCLFLLLTLGCCFIYIETKNCIDDCLYDDDIRKDIIDLSLTFSSISTLFFLGNLIIRYYHYFYLYKNKKYIQSYNNFFQTSLFKYLIIEFILAILHPNLLFKNKYFTTDEKYNLKKFTYYVNDIFSLIQCTRLLYLIEIFVICSQFYSARADRICKMMGKKLDLFFSFRALFINRTALMLGYCSIIICCMLAYMLKILSYPVNYDLDTKFKSIGNCFWFVVITMTTVGYGDIFPISTLGRVLGMIIAMSGTVVVALIVSFFNEKTTMSKEETNTLDFLQRVNEKLEIRKASAIYFKTNMMYIINKKKMEKGVIPPTKSNKKKLIELIKQKIEARQRYKFLFHQFHIHFRMGNDIDLIKRIIDNLDYAEDDLTRNINLINFKIKDLIKNINEYSDSRNLKSKRVKSESNIFGNGNNKKNKASNFQEINEIEMEPQDSE